MEQVSDEGLKGILAHEETHVREHHILVTLAYACTYSLVALSIESNRLFLPGFILFMTLRRYLEYRADTGSAKRVGQEATMKGLREIGVIYPSKAWSRWLVFAMDYPTLLMRIQALETGRRVLF
jgi:Zn-dependent protease with chaperone function